MYFGLTKYLSNEVLLSGKREITLLFFQEEKPKTKRKERSKRKKSEEDEDYEVDHREYDQFF